MLNRRQFVRGCSAAAAAALITPAANRLLAAPSAQVPGYLKDFAAVYAADPHAAALKWFDQAKFGLFMHYGLYSQLGRGEWVLYRENIPLDDYEKLAATFKPDKFDADFITDLALEAGMKYVNLTSKHHDGFCLFDTGKGTWNSVAAAGRDLCAELAEQCHKKGLGCFFYYSLLADWHHPYFYERKDNPIARPNYKTRPEQYKFEKDEDFQHYLDDAVGHIQTLLTNYGPVAGIWIDPLMGYYGRPDLFPMQAIYHSIRKRQPQCLISAKQGITGTEDFAAPERSGRSLEDIITKRYGADAGAIAAKAWASNQQKHNEICDTLQPHIWGYKAADDDKHLDAPEVRRRLAAAFEMNCNLLMNTGPLPDGSIHPVDIATLRDVGQKIRAEGYPAPAPMPAAPAPKMKHDKSGAAAQ